MKTKTLIILCFFFVTVVVTAQVGIGTTNPQETLHIAGTTSNIRVDGLNSINNGNNLGGSNYYNMMVDANGTLGLSLQSGLLSSDSMISSTINLQTTSNSGLNSTELYQKNFTLSQRALVHIFYTIPISVMSYDGLTELADGRAKIIHNYFYLGDGTTANTSIAYGMKSCVYANVSSDTASSSMVNSNSIMLTLNPGNYSIHMYASVFGGDITSAAAFRALFTSGDQLNISVIYL